MESTYKAVIDIVGLEEAYPDETIRAAARNTLEHVFFAMYNHFTDLFNKNIEQFNADWEKVKTDSSQTYEEFIKAKQMELIENDRYFAEGKRSGSYVVTVDDECQFVLVLLILNICMGVHLEAI